MHASFNINRVRSNRNSNLFGQSKKKKKKKNKKKKQKKKTKKKKKQKKKKNNNNNPRLVFCVVRSRLWGMQSIVNYTQLHLWG